MTLAILTTLFLSMDNNPLPQLAKTHQEAMCRQSWPGWHGLKRGSVLERCGDAGTLLGTAFWQSCRRAGCSVKAAPGVGG